MHLAVVEVVVVGILVGDVQRERTFGDFGIGGRRKLFATTAHADAHTQRAQQPALVAFDLGRGVRGIDVHHRGVLDVVAFGILDNLEDGVRCRGAGLRGLQHPFQHRVFIIIVVRGPPGGQIAVPVEQMAVELEARQETLLGHQRAVVGLDVAVLGVCGHGTEVIVVADAVFIDVGDNLAVVDGGLVRAAGDVAVEHTVHHHRLDVLVSGGHVVVAHDTADIVAAGDVGITVAVDDACRTVEQAHQTADIVRAADRAALDAAVVNASVARGLAADGADIAGLSTAAGAGALDEQVLDDRVVGIGQQGTAGTERAQGTVDGTAEGIGRGAHGFIHVEVLRQDVVATHRLNVARMRDEGGHQRQFQMLRGAAGGHELRLVRVQFVQHLRMVEAGHQHHVAAAVIDDHEGGVGGVQCRLVVARGVLAVGLQVQQRQRARRPLPRSAGECRGAGVRGEVASRLGIGIDHALYLYVIGVEAVLSGCEVGSLGVVLSQCLILGTRFAEVQITHLSINVEVGLQVPLHIRRGFLGAGRCGTNGQRRAADLGITAALLHEEGGRLRGVLRGGTGVGVGVLGLHVVGDVPVALLASDEGLALVVRQVG